MPTDVHRLEGDFLPLFEAMTQDKLAYTPYAALLVLTRDASLRGQDARHTGQDGNVAEVGSKT